MTIELDQLTYEARYADTKAHEALARMVAAAERHAADLRRYFDDLERAKTQQGKINAVNAAINCAAGGTFGNMRLDLAADAQANLAVILEQRRAAGLDADNADCQMVVILKKSEG